MVQTRSFHRRHSRNQSSSFPSPDRRYIPVYKAKHRVTSSRHRHHNRNTTAVAASNVWSTHDNIDCLMFHMPPIQPTAHQLKRTRQSDDYDSELLFPFGGQDMNTSNPNSTADSDSDFPLDDDKLIIDKESSVERRTSIGETSPTQRILMSTLDKLEKIVLDDKDVSVPPAPASVQPVAISEIALKRATAATARPAEAECVVPNWTPPRSPHEGAIKQIPDVPQTGLRMPILSPGIQAFGTNLLRDECPSESVSYDQIQGVQRRNVNLIQEDKLRLSTVTIRSASDSCLPQMMENTDPHLLIEVRKNLMQKSSAFKDEWATTIDSNNQIKSLTDDFGLPLYNSPNHDLSSPPSLEQELNSMALYHDGVDGSPVSTPPISHCNSTAWSDSYNGSDSWEDLRTESQVMNSVHQTIRHELANMQRLQTPPVQKPPSNENGLNNPEFKASESEENVWRTLRDKARASLPQSPSPPHGRTIETQIPMNWPPRHGLHIQTQERHYPMGRKHSSSSSEGEETVEDSLTTYLQHSVSYLGDSGPRLVDRPSVELIEGTLLARWCKKDNRTWLWKSSRRWRRFNGILMEPNSGQRPPAGHTFAKRWKKDNRTWLWKSSVATQKVCITELSN